MKDGGPLGNADGNPPAVKKLSPGKTIRLAWQRPDAAPDTPVEAKLQLAGAAARR